MKKHLRRKLIPLSLVFLTALCAGTGTATAFQVKEGDATLIVTLRLPKDYEFIRNAPNSLSCETPSMDVVEIPKPEAVPSGNTYRIPLKTKPGAVILTLRAKAYYCQKSSKMCFQDSPETKITFDVGPQGSSKILYSWDIVPQ